MPISNRRLSRYACVIALAATGFLTAIATPSTADTSSGIQAVPIGWYRIRNDKAPGECMQANPATAPNNGTLIGMWPCNDSAHQRWFFGTANTEPFREVRNGAGGCLDGNRKGTRVTKIVHLWTCVKNDAQAWAFSDPPGKGVVCIKFSLCSNNDALVLDKSDDETGGFGDRINLWDKNGTDAQTFSLEPVS